MKLKILGFDLASDPEFGTYYLMRVDADAEEALLFNIKLVETYELPIFVSWRSAQHVPPRELAELLAKAVLIRSMNGTIFQDLVMSGLLRW